MDCLQILDLLRRVDRGYAPDGAELAALAAVEELEIPYSVYFLSVPESLYELRRLRELSTELPIEPLPKRRLDALSSFASVRQCDVVSMIGAEGMILHDWSRNGKDLSAELYLPMPKSIRLLSGLRLLRFHSYPARPAADDANFAPLRTLAKKPTVFLSYNWGSDELVNQIEESLAGLATLVRDKSHVKPWDSLSEFMRSIRRQDFVVLVLSKAYLESRNCMFEATQLMKDENWRAKTMFVVEKDAQLYTPQGRAYYVRYWTRKASELETEIRELPPAAAVELGGELRILNHIRDFVGRLLEAPADACNPAVSKAVEAIRERIIGGFKA